MAAAWGSFGLADDLEERELVIKLDLQKMFWAFVLFGRSERSAYGQTQGFFLVFLEGKEILLKKRGSLSTSSSVEEVHLWHNFSKNWKKHTNKSNQMATAFRGMVWRLDLVDFHELKYHHLERPQSLNGGPKTDSIYISGKGKAGGWLFRAVF